MFERVVYGDLFTPRTTFRRIKVDGVHYANRVTANLTFACALVIVEPLGNDAYYIYVRNDFPERQFTAALEEAR